MGDINQIIAENDGIGELRVTSPNNVDNVRPSKITGPLYSALPPATTDQTPEDMENFANFKEGQESTDGRGREKNTDLENNPKTI